MWSRGRFLHWHWLGVRQCNHFVKVGPWLLCRVHVLAQTSTWREAGSAPYQAATIGSWSPEAVGSDASEQELGV